MRIRVSLQHAEQTLVIGTIDLRPKTVAVSLQQIELKTGFGRCNHPLRQGAILRSCSIKQLFELRTQVQLSHNLDKRPGRPAPQTGGIVDVTGLFKAVGLEQH